MKRFIYVATLAVAGFGGSCTQKAAVAKTRVPDTNLTEEVAVGGAAPAKMPSGKTELPFDQDVTRGTLANGLEYFIRPNARPEDRAELRLVVKAGSILEDDDQQGLAHFVEHMAFNGTENYAENELVDYLQSTGARFGPDLNAYTSFDETVYLLQVRTDSAVMFDKGLGILRDWAGGITFDDAEIDKERGVVLSEWRSGLGAQERLRDKTLPVTFANSRYVDRLPIGDTTVLKRAPYDALKRFYRDWYRPDLMAVIAVGDIEPAEVEAQIKVLFGDLKNPNKARERTEYPGPSYDKTQVVVATDPEASYALLQVSYLLPEATMNDESDFRADLVASLYNSMLGARFAERREDPATPFSFASSGRGGMVGDVDSYRSFAVVKPGKATEALTDIIAENRRVLQYGFTASELDRAKANVANGARQAAQQAETTPSGSFASALVQSFLDDEPLVAAEQNLELTGRYLDGIRLAEVNALATEYLADRPRSVVLTGSTNETFPTEAELELALRAADITPVTAYEDKVVAGFDIPALPPVGIKDRKVFEANDVTIVTLANGVRVAYKPTKITDDQILFAGVSRGGSNQFADADFPTADFVNAIGSTMGTGPLTPSELSKALAGKTVGLRAGISDDTEGLSGQATPETLPDLMQLIYLHFQGNTFRPELGQAMLDQQRSFIANLAANPDFRFQQEVSEALYGKDNPRHQMPSLAMIDAVDLQRGFEMYRERFADGHDWQFSFVGDFEPDTLLAYAQRYLGNLPTQASVKADQYRDPDDKLKTGSIEKRFKAGTAPKSNALVMRAGDFEDDERERIVFGVMRDVLNEELREELRERLGGVYGVRVSGNTDVLPRPEYSLSISFNAEPERVDELLGAVQTIVDRIIADGPEDKTLPNIRTTQYEGMKVAMKNNNGFWLPVMERAYTLDRDIDNASAERLKTFLDGVTKADIQRALKQYWVTEAKTQVEMVMDPEG